MHDPIENLSNAPQQADEIAGTTRDMDCNTLAAGTFDYSQYDDAIAAELRNVAVSIHGRDGDAKAAIIDIGSALLRVKDKVGHGNWVAWLNAEFEWSVSTAERYMSVAERFGDKFVTVTNLHAKTLYLLTAKSTPTAVVDEIIADLDAGRPVSNEAIREQVSHAKREVQRAAEEAKRRPLQRRTRAQRQAEEERQRQKAHRAKADRETAAATAAEILVECLGVRLDEFVALLNKVDFWRLSEVLRAARSAVGCDEVNPGLLPAHGATAAGIITIDAHA